MDTTQLLLSVLCLATQMLRHRLLHATMASAA